MALEIVYIGVSLSLFYIIELNFLYINFSKSLAYLSVNHLVISPQGSDQTNYISNPLWYITLTKITNIH